MDSTVGQIRLRFQRLTPCSELEASARGGCLCPHAVHRVIDILLIKFVLRKGVVRSGAIMHQRALSAVTTAFAARLRGTTRLLALAACRGVGSAIYEHIPSGSKNPDQRHGGENFAGDGFHAVLLTCSGLRVVCWAIIDI